jgi:hypothetical protein
VFGDAQDRVDLFVADTVPPEAPVLLGIQTDEEAVILNWQPSSDADVSNYQVHFGQISGAPYEGKATVFGDPSPVSAGLDTITTIYGLSPGSWYFAVTATDRCGNTSKCSNEKSLEFSINYRPVFYHRVIHIDPDLPEGTIVDTLLATDRDEGQSLNFYFTADNTEDAFELNEATGILSVARASRLDYFLTQVDTFLLNIGVRDNGTPRYSDEGLVMVVLNVNTWVPKYSKEDKAVLELYPNPAMDELIVKLGESGWAEHLSLSVYGTDGRCHLRKDFRQLNQFELSLSVEGLDQGVYHVVLETGLERRTGKLVIMR